MTKKDFIKTALEWDLLLAEVSSKPNCIYATDFADMEAAEAFCNLTGRFMCILRSRLSGPATAWEEEPTSTYPAEWNGQCESTDDVWNRKIAVAYRQHGGPRPGTGAPEKMKGDKKLVTVQLRPDIYSEYKKIPAKSKLINELLAEHFNMEF